MLNIEHHLEELKFNNIRDHYFADCRVITAEFKSTILTIHVDNSLSEYDIDIVTNDKDNKCKIYSNLYYSFNIFDINKLMKVISKVKQQEKNIKSQFKIANSVMPEINLEKWKREKTTNVNTTMTILTYI